MTDFPDGIGLTSASHPVPDDIQAESTETVEIELPERRVPMVNGTRVLNDHGVGFHGIGNERMRDLRVYVERGQVQVWVEIHYRDQTYDALQYLNPIEAMAFAKAFERCAIKALKHSA